METVTAKDLKKPGFIEVLRTLPKDWIVSSTRTSLFRFFYQMVLPYLSIYTIALGANGSELGLINSIAMAVAGFLGLFIGYLMDRIGPKKIYLIGILFLCSSWFIYGIAKSWLAIIPARILFYFGFKTGTQSCGTICANCLTKENRATAMSLCETLAAGILGIIGPMIGAFVVGHSGGISVQGIRPLFFISFAGNVLCFLLVFFKLSDRHWGAVATQNASPFSSIGEIFKHGKYLKRFIVVSVIMQLPEGMIIPFTQPFAALRGANEFVLGGMVTGFAIAPLILGIPIGRLADKIGKKRMLFITAPLFWLSCVLLIFSKSSAMFIICGILQGGFTINSVLTAALQFELIGPEYMGRWIGVLSFFQMIAQAVISLIAGVIWDKIGPQYIFIIPILLDICVRMPLLAGIHEEANRQSL